MLAGLQHAADNATVYDLLKSLTGSGPLQPLFNLLIPQEMVGQLGKPYVSIVKETA
jgi:hypothetical protein